MYLETLVSDKGHLSIGIIELENENSLNTDQLLELVSNLSPSVEAVQLFDGSKIVDEQHLLSASQNAVNAWKGKYAQSRSLSVEIAVFASGQHQIGRALSTLGISDNLPTIAAVVISSNIEDVNRVIATLSKAIGKQNEPEFSHDLSRLERIMKLFDISKEEVEIIAESNTPHDIQSALSRCVVSRVSTVAFDI